LVRNGGRGLRESEEREKESVKKDKENFFHKLKIDRKAGEDGLSFGEG
jgi:hypothetical protein